MYVLHNVKERDYLQDKLTYQVKSRKCGICFEPTNDLLSTQAVKVYPDDLIFELCDGLDNNVAELLLSYENQIINGKQAALSLPQRLQILEDIALMCVPHTERLEIFLGDNNPYLPDYFTCKLTCAEISETLYNEYQKDSTTPFIPCVHLVIETQDRLTIKSQAQN